MQVTGATGASHALEDEQRLLAALRAGDETAFAALVERYHATMVRIAQSFLGNRGAAEEAVQETWLAVLRGLASFEGRSSLKTWIFRILANRARTRAERDGRVLPFSALNPEPESEAAVDPGRFFSEDHPQWPGAWATPPQSWSGAPEQRLLARETRDYIKAAIATLPQRQQTVITLRDVAGWSADEVRDALGLSEGNQRVLLHRARSRVRQALEQYLAEM